MELASFGCSLIYGTELPDSANTPSSLTWPALLAKSFGLDYKCFAIGGRGNLLIMDRLTRQVLINPNRLFVIQWTYIDRFDYSDPSGRHMATRTSNDYLTALPGSESSVDKFYFKNFHSEYKDKITNLAYIKCALDLLLENRCKFVMTCVDDSIWCDQYHTSAAMQGWQTYIKSQSTFFDGKNFVAWCRDLDHPIGSMGHPLEKAHNAAAGLMHPVIDAILHKA